MSELQRRTARYSLIQIFLWSGYVPIIGFTSVYFLAHGFTNTQIGEISAVASILSALLQTVLATSADRPESPSLKVYLTVIAGVMAVLTGMLFLMGKSQVLTGLLFGAVMALLPTLTPLVNSLATASINQGNRLNYGIARGIGSLSYATVSSIQGFLVAGMGAESIPVCIIIFSLGFIASVSFFPFHKTPVKAAASRVRGDSRGFFKRYPGFAGVLVGCILIYVCHALINNFVYQITLSKGGASTEMGRVMTICACFEIPVMFLFEWMVRKISSSGWLKVMGVFYTLKSLGTLLVSGMAGLYAVQPLQMFAWGISSVATVHYVNALMEPQDAIKGQAFITATFSIGTVIGSLAGGWLLDAAGVNAMLLFGTAISAAGMLILFVFCKKPDRSAETITV